VIGTRPALQLGVLLIMRCRWCRWASWRAGGQPATAASSCQPTATSVTAGPAGPPDLAAASPRSVGARPAGRRQVRHLQRWSKLLDRWTTELRQVLGTPTGSVVDVIGEGSLGTCCHTAAVALEPPRQGPGRRQRLPSVAVVAATPACSVPGWIGRPRHLVEVFRHLGFVRPSPRWPASVGTSGGVGAVGALDPAGNLMGQEREALRERLKRAGLHPATPGAGALRTSARSAWSPLPWLILKPPASPRSAIRSGLAPA
jgi:hypothetical protein